MAPLYSMSQESQNWQFLVTIYDLPGKAPNINVANCDVVFGTLLIPVVFRLQHLNYVCSKMFSDTVQVQAKNSIATHTMKKYGKYFCNSDRSLG